MQQELNRIINLMYNIRRAQLKAKEKYGIDITDDAFEEIALEAWDLLGNKRTMLYRYRTSVDSSLTVQLPCNCEYIESVTYGFEDPQLSSNIHEPGDDYKTHTEQYIEFRKPFKDPYYESGRFVKYRQVGDTLQFAEPCGPITIVYHGVVLDDEGLPEITEKEANAIAAFVAYTQLYKKGLMTMNTNIITIAKDLEQKWFRLRDAAITPEYISQNDMDKILDAKTTWNRKVHNKSYKPTL